MGVFVPGLSSWRLGLLSHRWLCTEQVQGYQPTGIRRMCCLLVVVVVCYSTQMSLRHERDA